MINRSGRPKILGVTLARSGSKGVPGKNVKDLAGRPLLAYTIDEAKKSQWITDYIVSTESRDVQLQALQLGAQAPFLRPSYLATDTATSAHALIHAVEWMEKKHGQRFEYVVELMATNPLKTVEDIDSCLSRLVDTGADSVVALNEVGDGHPARLKKIVGDKIVDFCVPEPLEARRQDLIPKAFIRSGSIYALRRDELMVHGRRYGSNNSVAYILPAERAINIDSELDWIVAESLIRRMKESHSAYD